MARHVWDVLLRNRMHRIELEHGYFTGRRRLTVDGQTILEQAPGIIDFGSEHPFEVAGVPCEVVITENGISFQYHLVVDGAAHPHGGQVPRPIRRKRVGGVLAVVNRYAKYMAVLLAVLGLALLALGVQSLARLVSFPEHPPRVALAAAGTQPDDAWVTLEGLRIDCGSAPIRLHGTNYYLAGQDGGEVPVAVAVDDESCPGEQASGVLHEMGGRNGAEFRRRTGAPKVLVLSTWGGPAHELAGVAVFSLMALLGLGLAWLFALHAYDVSRPRSAD
ncbi:hypothetical protein F0U59_46740 [Archangium gephyra]|nr:hypothetical protein F0U59_46740 [Archangium gephyra]